MGPLIGMLMGGGASGLLGGAGGGGFMGGIMSSLMNNGGLGGLLSNLFGGGQQGGASAAGGNDQTNQLLGDIKDMLSQLLDKEGGAGGGSGAGDCAGGSHGVSDGGCHKAPGGDEGHGCSTKPPSCHDEPGCGGSDEPDCGDADDHGCDDADEPACCGSEPSGCDDAGEPDCGGAEEHGCDDAGETEWDGADKSPSLDRERGAARLLEQAKNTDDPAEKRELIDMAMEMLGDGPKKKKGFLSDVINDMRQKQDGNSYDKDIVKQADKMLDQIDEGHLNDCSEGKALDSVIDMLMEEGGVDGKPANGDTNGDGREDPQYRPFGDVIGHPVAAHQHLHSALFDHHH